LFLSTSQKSREHGNINRTFFNSSISSALRISHSRLSTTASLVKRLISSSSFVFSGPFCDIDNEEVGRWVRGDDGPATGELSDDFRMGAAREEALDDGRPSLVDGEPGVGFCLRKKSPAVVGVVFGMVSAKASGLWFCSGVHNGLVERASGGIAGGEVALCGVCAPPPRILRKPFILGDCKAMKEATASLKNIMSENDHNLNNKNDDYWSLHWALWTPPHRCPWWVAVFAGPSNTRCEAERKERRQNKRSQ
jgi:hypothetical protein